MTDNNISLQQPSEQNLSGHRIPLAGDESTGSLVHAGAITLSVAGLYISSLHSYLLFHSLIEFLTIAIAFTLFIITWNTRRFQTGGYLIALGTGYGLIALIDLLHALAYKGMGVFPGYDANLPTQLWIAARSLQALLLILAPLFARRDLQLKWFLTLAFALVAATTTLVYAGAFPDCYIEGVGLTRFKIVSEYLISALLLGALGLFIRQRSDFNPRLVKLIIASILCTIGSELAFTSYLSVFGAANMVGHFFKLAAFYLLYRALIVTGLNEPFALIFHNLKQAEHSLTREREFNQCLLESMADGVAACDADGQLTLFNRTARQWHGLDPMRLPPEDWARHYNLFGADGTTPLPTEEIPLTRAFRGKPVQDVDMTIVAAGQAPRLILANGSLIRDENGHNLGAVVVMRDVTELRRVEESLRKAKESLEQRVAERTAELEQTNAELQTELNQRRRAEDQLRRSEHGLAEAQRIGHLGSWELDLVTNLLSWSDEIYRIFEIDPGSFGASYQAFLNAIHPADREWVNQAYQDSVKNKIPYDIVHRLQMADGRVKYVNEKCETYFAADGSPLWSVGTVHDITARILNEAALQRLNRELQAISHCNQALMHAENEQNLLEDICRIVCDDAGYRMAWVGYPEQDLAKTIRPVAWAGVEEGYLAETRITWGDTERGQGPTGSAIRRGKSVCSQDFDTDPTAAPWREAALQRGYLSSIALPLKDKSTNTFGVLNIYAAEPRAFTPDEIRLLEELAGDMAFGIMVLRARIEREQAEEKNQQLAALVESSQDAIIGKSLDGVITSWNRGATNIYGYTENEMLGQSVMRLVPPGREEEMRRILARISAGEQVEHHQTLRRRKDGQQIQVSLSVAPLKDGLGKIIGASAIGRDITRQKEAEQTLTRLKEDLEHRVAERTAELKTKNTELERMNKLFVGRELKMVELKKRIKKLEKLST